MSCTLVVLLLMLLNKLMVRKIPAFIKMISAQWYIKNMLEFPHTSGTQDQLTI